MAKLTVPIRVDALEEAKEYSKELYDKGYQQGRADAIEEVKKVYQEKGYDGQFEDWLLEQLKEVAND